MRKKEPHLSLVQFVERGENSSNVLIESGVANNEVVGTGFMPPLEHGWKPSKFNKL